MCVQNRTPYSTLRKASTITFLAFEFIIYQVRIIIFNVFQLITLETTMRLYWQDYRLNVSHLLPINPHKNASDDYILLHPDTAHYIWFPDIYIGKWNIRNIENKVFRETNLDFILGIMFLQITFLIKIECFRWSFACKHFIIIVEYFGNRWTQTGE